ncbi:MAG: hypothetical protein DRI86_07760 [Bacteroidetes bacterium]|nr:MAG: hypothetical protein DRI86_07760 [Bacteroidota bacterium]
MQYTEDNNPLNQLPDQIKAFLNSKADLISLFFVKKLNQLIPNLVLGFILFFTFLFFTLFFSYSFIQWYSDYVGNASTASLIVSAFYLLLAIVMFVFRKFLIKNPIQKRIIQNTDFSDIHRGTSLGTIHNVQHLDEEMERLINESEISEDELGESMDNIKEFYSYDSIKDRFFTQILNNPRPAISTLLQTIMSVRSFTNKRKSKRENKENNI